MLGVNFIRFLTSHTLYIHGNLSLLFATIIAKAHLNNGKFTLLSKYFFLYILHIPVRTTNTTGGLYKKVGFFMFSFLPPLLIIFILYIIIVRMLGKSALAQLTPHDFAALFFLAYVAFQPIQIDTYFQSIIGLIAVALTHYLLSRLSLVDGIKHLIIGQPTLLIRHGEIIPHNLKKAHFSLVELLTVLRTSGNPRVRDVEYAFLETNGEVSVIPKREVAPLTPKDMGMELEYEGIPLAMIIEGKIQRRNLSLIDKNEEWLENQVKNQGMSSMSNIFFAYILDGQHTLEIITYSK